MELGAIYSKEKTVFSVFSPIAEEISVILSTLFKLNKNEIYKRKRLTVSR